MDVSQAKFRMYNRSPFFGTIIFNLEVVEEEAIGTLGVDGEKLYYSKKFWEKLPNKQKLGVFAHELGHLFLDHLNRKKDRIDVVIDPKTGNSVSLWNLAADYSTNLIIVDMLGRDFLPADCLYDVKFKEMSTEKIYDELKKKIPQMSSQELANMIANSFSNKSKWSKLKGQSKKDAQGKIQQILQQAIEAAKSKGDIPASLRRLFDEMKPKEDWRKVLLDYVQPFINDYNLSRPDRRFLEEPFYLPDIKEGEQVDWLAIAIDTSGSISGKEMNSFISEIKAILGSYDKVKIKLTFCDTEATPFLEMDEYDPKNIRPVGGGGTDFRPVFRLIEKEESKPQALLYFTDMYGEFPNKSFSGYDTIWISTTGRETRAPFGTILEYKP